MKQPINSFFFRFFLMLSVLVFLAVGGCRPAETDSINIVQALSAEAGGDCFDAATFPAAFKFPQDHGPHPAFQTEWWYYTGNLRTDEGQHFGYQLTFFRRALACESAAPPAGSSQWRTRQIYFAHFAVTDTRGNRFHASSRMNRQSLGIAGGKAAPFRVWVDNWSASGTLDEMVLTARENDTTLSLRLTREGPLVLQGDQGFSRKGPALTNASYYYSLPRLTTRGTLKIGSQIHKVKGSSWFDHEWSTTVLGRDVGGWDWFSIHLKDGRDLMVCQIRDAAGRPNGYGFGSLSRPDGTYEILTVDQFTITPTGYWTSPSTGKPYPGEWEIAVPDKDLSMHVAPVIPDQEHTHTMVYWEGAVKITGEGGNQKIQGEGYVEMTGY
jgi:predicted secreted hydrolase